MSDKNFNYISHINRYESGSSGDKGISNAANNVNRTSSLISVDSNGITTFNIVFTTILDVAYIQISATGKGSDMMITINEDII